MTAIQRADKTQHTYKRVCMDFANDPRLSWEARGMMAYLLSKSDDWRIIPADLINQTSAGRDKVYQILDELQQAGYLTRHQGRGDRGRVLPVEYTLAEVSPLTASPDTVNTDAVNSPLPASPYTAPPLPANPTLPKEESTYSRFGPTGEIPERSEAQNAPASRTPRAKSKTNQGTATVETEAPQQSARTPSPQVPPAPSPAPVAPAGELAQPRLVETADADPVAVYREAAKVTKPNEAQRKAIRERVTGDVDLWRETCERFSRNGWNVRAVDNLLDAYSKAVKTRRAEQDRQRELEERRRAMEAPREELTPEQQALYREKWAEVKAKLEAKMAEADPYSYLWAGQRRQARAS